MNNKTLVSKLKFYIILSTFLFIGIVSYGQSITPNSGDIFEETSDVPIDGAITLLAATGLGIGIKRLYQRKK